MDAIGRNHIGQLVQRQFLEFLEKFRAKREDGSSDEESYYLVQAAKMVTEEKKTLYVKMSHFGEVNADEVSFNPDVLMSVIQNKYMIVRDHLHAAIPQLLDKLDGDDLQEKIKKARAANEAEYVIAFHGMPGTFSGIRSLRAECLGRMMTISGTVIRTSDIKPELLVGSFSCNECNRVVTGVEQQFKYTLPQLCPDPRCGNRSNWTLLEFDKKGTRFGDWQRLRLQEGELEVPAGAMPRSIDVIVRGETCEVCKPGDKVLITGSLIVVPDVPTMMNPADLKQQVRRALTRTDANYAGGGMQGLRGMGNRDLTYKMSFFGSCVESNSDWSKDNAGEDIRGDDKPHLTQADRDKFNKISERKSDCFDVVARCVAPHIHGCLEMKKGILLMLVGATSKKTPEGIKLRGDINVCLLGDPATAKSALLKWTSKFLPRAVFASGKSSTAAGLTASVTRDMEMDQEKVIQPGALMLADNGICCIDEFELMDQKDQSAIHEAMEQQTITLSKAGIQATLNARASILASCLPRNTYYDTTQPLHKNCELTPPIMSRFDLMFVMQDVHDENNDDNIANHIMRLHRFGEEHTVKPTLSELELQRYIRVARSFKPRMQPASHSRIIKCYLKLREDRVYVRGSCGVTVRQLESLVRLSEAIARIHLSEFITVEHVNMAFELQLNTLKRLERENIDLEGFGAEEPPAEEAQAPPGDAPPAAAAGPAVRKKITCSYAQYQRISHMLTRYLYDKEGAGEEVKEEDLFAWYLEQVEEDIKTEADLKDQEQLLKKIVERLIMKDRVIIVARPSEDPAKPEGRILVKHPNYPVGEVVGA
eukprot:CAMPEP_0206473818 /NCGR_PEP_ID=MMETSP0324_2-20121206/33112_1 /ASSEMBLY_ACC=CAM_ASM_000836 /TAXON_ID=2866 /ORGANISM="Crypthecodinium cohnii, Strain Seligo" /LENGTH=819 /DNA_ID=CAMNT_0053948861 /DNA_START=29 /DNA_END=2488 /DNA_ORIENTATION=-